MDDEIVNGVIFCVRKVSHRNLNRIVVFTNITSHSLVCWT